MPNRIAAAGAAVAAVTLIVSLVGARQLAAIRRRLDSRHDADTADAYIRGLQRRSPDGGGDGPHLHVVP